MAQWGTHRTLALAVPCACGCGQTFTRTTRNRTQKFFARGCLAAQRRAAMGAMRERGTALRRQRRFRGVITSHIEAGERVTFAQLTAICQAAYVTGYRAGWRRARAHRLREAA